jgi:hypothetical protein
VVYSFIPWFVSFIPWFVSSQTKRVNNLFLGLCPHKPNGLIMRITHHYIYYGKMMKDFSHGLKTGASYCGYLRLGLAGDSIELEPRIWFRTLSCARDGSKLAPH